jgi:hypothetical protein
MPLSEPIKRMDLAILPTEIDPEHVVTPGIFVDRIVKVPEGGLGSPEQLKALVSKLTEIEIVRKLLFR